MNKVASLMGDAVRQHQAGQLAEAAALYRRILVLDPRQAQAHSNLGAALRGLGRPEEAEESYRRAIALTPGFADAHVNLANLLKQSGRLDEAVASYRRALALKSGDAGLYYNYGMALQAQAHLDEAVAAYRQALRLKPRFAEALTNLGVALADKGQFAEAAETYRKAIAVQPDLVQAHNNLGLALQEQGRLDEAATAFDRALTLKPDYAESETNRIFAELYRPGVTLADMLRLSRHWSQTHAAFTPPAQGPRAAARPRLGFVSADFRQHAVGFLTIPALEGLARRGFELVCYSNSARSDALTARFRDAASLWREAAALDDAQLAEQIAADGIDILFDLSGHSRGNRLAAFARKPAPLAIGWVGYPATTGMTAIDYLLTDRWQTPQGADDFYSEKLLRLPHSYVAFEPPQDAPEPGALPARTNGFVTFASFNALKKMNAEVMALWSRILKALPDARLLLKSPALNCVATRRHIAQSFAEQGVAAGRLTFLGSTSPAEHVTAMARADIALDTFPYSGGMTTLESLWMGLPVVTWPGETFASRHSLSYLTGIGLADLVAGSADAYCEKAVRLGADIEKLSVLRASMRARMLASPLCDVEGFAADLSDALTSIWRRWRAGEATASVDAAP